MSITADLKVDTLERIANRIFELGDSLLHAVEVDAVNRTVDRAHRFARVEMNKGINLTTAYIESKMSSEYARVGKGGSGATGKVKTKTQYIFASRFDYRQLTTPAKNPKRAKGDPKRGIPKGQKAAGISVEVSRGSRKEAPKWFIVPLKQYAGDWARAGSFYRVGDGKKAIDPRYGPSAHQLFSHVINAEAERFSDMLSEEYLSGVDRVFRTSLNV